jgi:hypothetical protein
MRSDDRAPRAGYVVPRYRAPDAAPWYHALHGSVPGHQIDFICCPEVPDGPLTRTHFGHLARLMKYIEPRTSSPCAFAIGNLSRDDTQHEPGHGGIALILGLRVSGVTDSAGRQDPPFAHAIAAIDRDLGAPVLLDAGLALLRRLSGGAGRSPVDFYRAYARCVEEAPDRVPEVLARYLDSFGDLPAPPPSALPAGWEVEEGAPTAPITIAHREDEPLEAIAGTAAKIAAVLYRSNIRWTWIVSGGDAGVPGGLSIRFAPLKQANAGGSGLVIPMDEVSEGEEEIARELFGASRACPSTRRVPAWRAAYAAYQGASGGSGAGEIEPAEDPTLVRRVPERPISAKPAVEDEGSTAARREAEAEIDVAALGAPRWRSRWVALGLGCGLASAALLGLLSRGVEGGASPRWATAPVESEPSRAPAPAAMGSHPATRVEPAPAQVTGEPPLRTAERVSGSAGRSAPASQATRRPAPGEPRIFGAPPLWRPARQKSNLARRGK